MTSSDPLTPRYEELKALFPMAVTDGRVDLEKLRVVMGETAASGPERYGLSWAGKSDALKTLRQQTTATLLPAPSESVNWDATGNAIIEGDNLEVLKVLQNAYHGKVKLIYIDPPYNTGGDFIYPDDYAEGLASYQLFTRQVNEEGHKLTTNVNTSGRYHSRWLTMMYPRLFLARNLLREDGVLLVSIDDHEVHNLIQLLTEVFGEENAKTHLIWQKSNKPLNRSDDGFSSNTEYIVCFTRTGLLGIKGDPISEAHLKSYRNPDNDPRGNWIQTPLFLRTNSNKPKELVLPWSGERRTEKWFVGQKTLNDLWAEKRIWRGRDGNSEVIYKKNFLSEKDSNSMVPTNLLLAEKVGFSRNGTEDFAELVSEYNFPHPKPVSRF